MSFNSALLGLGILQLVNVNDMQVDGQHWLTVGGNDSNILMSVPAQAVHHKGVLIDYTLQDAPDDYKVNVYYSSNLHSLNDRFRYAFDFKSTENNRFYVPLDLVEKENLETIRLDIDHCLQCKIKINQITLLDELEANQNETIIPADYKSLAALKNRVLSFNEIRYQIDDFYLRGFEYVNENTLKVISRNPYIVSPLINAPLDRMYGIYLRLGVPESQRHGLYIKMSWRTKELGFRTKYRIRKGDVKGDTLEMYIPFTQLSEEKVIRKFKLQFEPDIGDVWRFEAIKVLRDEPDEALLSLVPALADFPGAVSPLPKMLKDSGNKLIKDWPFLIIYFLSLLSVIGFIFARLGIKFKRLKFSRK